MQVISATASSRGGRDDLSQLTGNPQARKGRIGDETQAFPGAIVDDSQNSEPASIGQLIRRNGSSSGKSRWLYTPAVRSSGGDPSDARQRSAWLRASPLMGWSASSSCRIMRRSNRRRLQCHNAMCRALPRSTELISVRTYSMLSVSDATAARLVLLQNADDLLVCETVALHPLVLSVGQSLLQNGLFQPGKVIGDNRVSIIRIRRSIKKVGTWYN